MIVQTVNSGKLGQMKIQQTAFMLIALTLFFVLVGLFVLGFGLSSLRGNADLLAEKEAQFLISKLSNAPEFSCGASFGNIQEIDCVDFDKVMALKERSGQYEDFFGVSDIKIRKVYPPADETSCTLSNYPDCSTIHLFGEENKGTYVSTYVALCHKVPEDAGVSDKCELARMMASYEVTA